MIKTDDLYADYGYDIDADPDAPEVYREMTFSFSDLSDDTTVDAALTVGLTNESTEYLPKIMEEFQKFLRFAGFDYLTIQKLEDGVYGYGAVN